MAVSSSTFRMKQDIVFHSIELFIQNELIYRFNYSSLHLKHVLKRILEAWCEVLVKLDKIGKGNDKLEDFPINSFHISSMLGQFCERIWIPNKNFRSFHDNCNSTLLLVI